MELLISDEELLVNPHIELQPLKRFQFWRHPPSWILTEVDFDYCRSFVDPRCISLPSFSAIDTGTKGKSSDTVRAEASQEKFCFKALSENCHDVDEVTLDGRLFYTRKAAAGNAR